MARKIDTDAEIDAIRIADRAGDPAAPGAGYKLFYGKSGGLYIINSAGTVVGPLSTTFTFGFHVPGTLTTGDIGVRLLAPYTGVITNVVAAVDTAPTDDSVIVDIHKGGVTIFTTQGNRPTITTGNNDDTSSVPDITAVTQNDVFTCEIDNIGSTAAGADLNVQIRGYKTA